VSPLALFLLAVVGGTALMVVAATSQVRAGRRAIDDLLGMWPEGPVPELGDDELTGLTAKAVDLAGQAVDTLDDHRSLADFLERARIAIRPGEFVIILTGGALGTAALLLTITGSILLAVAATGGALFVAVQIMRRRVTKRRRAFETQLPDALSLVASSLSAGHTFLRAIQMMYEESGPPLSEEFSRVVAETRLGDPVVNALDRTAGRLAIRDLDMVVQAVRIQQTVGGRLADLLHTLADVIRARGELRREVQVLTAEGRLSAYVLAGMVPFLFLTIQVVNPVYIKPLYHGSGLVLLVGCAVSVLAGLLVILRMVKIDV
jgi:tight adherence protein B